MVFKCMPLNYLCKLKKGKGPELNPGGQHEQWEQDLIWFSRNECFSLMLDINQRRAVSVMLISGKYCGRLSKALLRIRTQEEVIICMLRFV